MYLWVLHRPVKRWDYVCISAQQWQRRRQHSILRMFYVYIGDGVGISFPFMTWPFGARKSIKRWIRCEAKDERKAQTFSQWSWSTAVAAGHCHKYLLSIRITCPSLNEMAGKLVCDNKNLMKILQKILTSSVRWIITCESMCHFKCRVRTLHRINLWKYQPN